MEIAAIVSEIWALATYLQNVRGRDAAPLILGASLMTLIILNEQVF